MSGDRSANAVPEEARATSPGEASGRLWFGNLCVAQKVPAMQEKNLVLALELAFVAAVCGVILSLRNPSMDGTDPFTEGGAAQDPLTEQVDAPSTEHQPVIRAEASF